MKEIPLSVVIIAKNEEEGIAETLQSVAWADDVVVIDLPGLSVSPAERCVSKIDLRSKQKIQYGAYDAEE